ncbi:LacI family DNA-binding transcriptional regulator [Martelella lutilitoris]|uniref:LacI family DNA-binding transcriptional regulator n=1 Tax=Martelella lutilitoris TaxID=2583532 RepID=A0A7T7HH41_9HYPH|nr:LacI family DNA-binding transcriptional regulator [Martelella lutilitoris]QQM29093.1 LacI family DNA-binding transcriptional regulator [Martelella lutilitoris]
MTTRGKKISQADIALRADVSISTVSRALGGAQRISPVVRERVRRIAEELGYSERERALPARMPEAEIKTVVYLPMHPVTGGLHPIFQETYDGMVAAAAENGLQLFPKLLPEEDLDIDFVTRQAEEHGTATAFMFYVDPIPEVARFFQENGSLVLVNNVDTRMRFDSVIVDNYAGMKRATEAMLEAGHRRLLFVAGNLRYSPRERMRGFFDAVSECPDASGEQLVIGHDRHETALEYFKRYFGEHESWDWTGMVCGNDLMAIGTMQAARENSLTVPDDFSVIGFDDISWSAMTAPRLDTIRYDRIGMAEEAIRLLRRRIEKPDAPVIKAVQGVTYIAGGTIRRMGG